MLAAVMAALAALAPAGPARACEVPVFRYALEEVTAPGQFQRAACAPGDSHGKLAVMVVGETDEPNASLMEVVNALDPPCPSLALAKCR